MKLERAETNWLASRNVFYNVRTNEISYNVNDLIDPAHLDIHPEGLYNYLQYGYSVFGQTPISEIKMLKHDQIIYKDDCGRLVIEQKRDSIEDLLGKNCTPDEIINKISKKINEWESNQTGKIILPISGGFDSRFLAVLCNDKKKIHAYTYGVSKNQKDSFEVVYAHKLCDILGIDWKQVELGNYHELIDEWNYLFGISTHSHGMYQMEFYKSIRQMEEGCCCVLSGIYGDLWAGGKEFWEIDVPEKLVSLGITHGMNADPSQILLSCNHELRDEYWENNKEKLQDKKWRIIEAGRTKITLISYLLRIPEHYGFSVWSPFVDESIVAGMLNLNDEERNKRKWQVDFFKNNDVLLGEMGLWCDWGNCLNMEAYKRKPLVPLKVDIFRNLINTEYIETVNNHLNVFDNEWIKYYSAYLTLFPISRLLSVMNSD